MNRPRLLVTLALAVFDVAIAGERLAQPIELWGRFEAVVVNLKPYADPYRDVSLEVTYTRPDGRTLAYWGFHDGGTTWRIRCLPDVAGTWRYAARFSDGSPGVSGRFDCVVGALPGPIVKAEANPIWFGTRGGRAVTLRALHVGDRFFARNWDNPFDETDGERRRAFLDWVQAHGYNTLSNASHYLNRRETGRGDGWETPRLWPLDAAAFRHMERILDELAARGIVVFPFAGFFGRGAEFPRDPAEQECYLRYTLARLGAYRHLLLNVAGPEPLLRGRPFLSREDLVRLGGSIRAYAVFGHLLTVHNPTGDDEFKDELWHDFGTLQGPKTLDRRRLAAGLLRNHHPTKPLLAQETLWSGNTFHIRSNQRDYSDADLRKHALVIHFSGANLVFADNDGDSSSGFTGTLDPALARTARHRAIRQAWDTFESLPFESTKPQPRLLSDNSGGAAFCLGDEGKVYLVYFDAAGQARLALPDGPYRATWIDAQSPADRRDGGELSGHTLVETPSGGDDWVLQLNRK